MTTAPGPEQPGRRAFRSLAAYGAVLLLTLLAMTWTLRLWKMDFFSPINYGGDGMQHLMFTKAFLENGWYLNNPMLGAPFGMEMYEFPAADTLPGLFIKLLGLFTHDPAVVTNLFFFLTFPLASLCAFFVCRQLGIAMGPSILSSVLYAFLPYHFWRAAGHLYLSAYFVAPLATLVAWWIATGRLRREDGTWNGKRLLSAAFLCVVVSLAGVYYPFFAGIILVAASFMVLFVRRDWRHFVAGGLLSALLVGGMLACLAPSLWHLRGSDHPPASLRTPGQAEIYGLKIIQLLLPPDNHRLPAFNTVKDVYNKEAPLVTENTSAALGIVGAAGFLWLIGWLVFRPAARVLPPERSHQILDTFSAFNGVAVLFGTIGGFGSLFAFFISPQVRSINRISVFIAFFALVAVAVGLERLSAGRRFPTPVRTLGWASLGVLLCLGIYDMSRPVYPENYLAAHKEYKHDRQFYKQVQAAIPAGGMIFQLPYHSFPEGGSTVNMDDYSHFRGYIHTRNVRWSFGGIRNGPSDLFGQHVTSLPTAQMVRLLALAGFSGIYIDRDGYADFGIGLEVSLRPLLGAPAAIQSNCLFFSLESYARSLRATMTPERWQQEQHLSLTFPQAKFLRGFADPESNSEHVWRWCAQDGELDIENIDTKVRRVQLHMLANTGTPGPTQLVMSTPFGQQSWMIGEERAPISATVDLPPGKEVIHFLCNGKPIDAPLDTRVLVWSATDFQIEEDLPPVAP